MLEQGGNAGHRRGCEGEQRVMRQTLGFLLLVATMICLTACGQQRAQGKDVVVPVAAPVSTLVTNPEPRPAPSTEHKTSSTNHPALSPDVKVSLTCKEHPEMQ